MSLKRIEEKAAQRSRGLPKGRVDAIVGSQWGDEGKGKLVDIVSGEYDICARVAGGSNAGHTIVVDVSYKCSFLCAKSYCRKCTNFFV